jgi:hypothetical protein
MEKVVQSIYLLLGLAQPIPATVSTAKTNKTNGSQGKPPVCGSRGCASLVGPGETGVAVGVGVEVEVEVGDGTGVLVTVGGIGVGVKPAHAIVTGAKPLNRAILHNKANRKTTRKRPVSLGWGKKK